MCPKCQERSWSSDYWICSNCGYSESREWVLLEENKDFKESFNKGDNPVLNLGYWIKEQKSLCQTMADYLLPNHNYKLSFRKSKSWGETGYWENDINRANQAEQRFRENGGIKEGFDWFRGVTFRYEWGVRRLTTYVQLPTEINISPHTLTTEHSDNTIYGVIEGVEGTGAGFLPTTAHESAHASHNVNWDILYKPWINEGHDEV